MKRILFFICGLALLQALSGCPGTVPTATFNDKAAIAERSVQLVQTTATALLRAGKLNVDEDRLIQKQVELAHDGIKLAKALEAKDPAAAAADLTAAIDIVNSLKKRTGATQ